jgi:hypothetical protein
MILIRGPPSSVPDDGGLLKPLSLKTVSRPRTGRPLTLNTQSKALAALNRAAGQNYALGDRFDY